ncbi:MAG: type II toxin-antitoxin system VapC family toxin [Halobacteriales archaeon]
MTVLVDTGVLYADHDTDATRHEAASTALEAVYDGEFGHPYVSDYVFDEAITLTRSRTGSYDPAKRLSDRLRGQDPYPRVYELIQVTSAVFEDALTTFHRYNDHALSFTDATSVAFIERHDLDGILSFDDDFDGLVDRIDPATV